ncbi:ran GTPase-activating protein 1-like [Periplaneta americana]|uniref:ran GTPase-activating protein 1-like n=1 Tax=Periplaneta americana TaxID=6978 RepID=UPI0037E79E04
MSLHHYRQYPPDPHAAGSDPVHGSESDVAALSDLEDDDDEEDDEDEEDEDDEDEEEEELPYPGFIPVALKYLDQNTRPRNWCLKMITNPYPFKHAPVLHHASPGDTLGESRTHAQDR